MQPKKPTPFPMQLCRVPSTPGDILHRDDYYANALGVSDKVPAFNKMSDLLDALTQTFLKFGDLPLETQMAIWKYFGRIEAETPNVIKIYKQVLIEPTEGPLEKHFKSRKYMTVRITSQEVAYKIPTIMSVCVASRAIGKQLYLNEFKTIPMGSINARLTYFNEDKDIVVLDDMYILQEWRYNRQTDSEMDRYPYPGQSQHAMEPVRRRINIRHLVVDGLLQSPYMWRMLGRFYDCETIIVASNRSIVSQPFSDADLFEPDRVFLHRLRDVLRGFWVNEREGPFVRTDYRFKPVRPSVVEPSWDPADTTISNPILLFWLPRNIMNDLTTQYPAIRQQPKTFNDSSEYPLMINSNFSHLHAAQFDHPWNTYVG
ncbi:hypothetical protein SBOR_7523 [Sclerotinia borealis F-4128]|uniref:2EXR domain-containing protein n=1 Tax=Sclerotinia borealis (strain F-4128) TaxID=1432307 RepID=W9C8B0_SCLBF|nr:hypothetical protein SBOR_7523 [Sclerotinia borealis F-4128]